ncbi:MAG TPA: SCO family protein [Chitinophagaceae bacterium]|nr:SCO family protein [Chitinophagaceae bacterium]HNF71559.1 SCO family protein [Chitinophagaceae bacterium]
MMQKHKTAIILVTFFMLLGTAFLAYYYQTMMSIPRRLKYYGNPGHTVSSFRFTNQDGKEFTEKEMQGKIYVVEYFFTTCKGICPKLNENMAKVYSAFRGQNDIAFLSHTVNPEIDSAAKLKAYARSYDADPAQWNFLTGTRHDLYSMAINSYLVAAVEDTTHKEILPDFIHTKYFVLVDKEKHIRGTYDGTDPGSVQQLIGDIKTLRKEYE